MSLQSIERLQNLLGRVERNAKLPRNWTQGLGAFVGAPALEPIAVSTQAAPAPVPLPAAPEPAAVAIQAAPEHAAVSAVPESLPPDGYEIDVTVSPTPPPVEARVAEQPPLEDVSLEELSGVEIEEPLAGEVLSAGKPIEEVEADEVTVELSSAEFAEALNEPRAAPPVAASAMPFTAPPSLDELTFSEPPPPLEPAPAEVEPPPVSAAQMVSEPPDSIEASLLAATEAQADEDEEEEEEGPALTPPPESGPQVAMPMLAAPAVPAELRGAAPTAEQLGDIVELEQASGPPLELAEAPESEPKPALAKGHAEELEFVPRAPEPSRPLEGREALQTLVGGFTDERGTGDSGAPETPPPHARIVVPPIGPTAAAEAAPLQPLAAQPSLTMRAATDTLPFGDEAPTASSWLAPEVVARPAALATRPVVDVIAAARAYRPESFLELLDASIGLLKK